MNAKQTPLVDLLRLHADDLHSAHGHNQSSRLLSRAADEVDQLKSNLVALEDEKNSYIDYVGDALGQDHDGETLWDAAQRVLSERDRLRAELAECKRDAERYRTALEQIVAPFEDLNFVSGNKLLTYIHDTATAALAAKGDK